MIKLKFQIEKTQTNIFRLISLFLSYSTNMTILNMRNRFISHTNYFNIISSNPCGSIQEKTKQNVSVHGYCFIDTTKPVHFTQTNKFKYSD